MAGILDILVSLEDSPKSHAASEETPSEVSGPLASRIHGKTMDEKAAVAWENRMRGMPVSLIASSFGVSIPTVYKWLQHHTEEFRKRMENSPAANIISESLMRLGAIREACLFEAHQDSGEVRVDEKTGELVRSKPNGNKVKYLEAAMRAEKMCNELLITTGIIPSEPGRVYHTLKGDDTGAADKKDLPSDRTTEEVREDIRRLLWAGRRI